MNTPDEGTASPGIPETVPITAEDSTPTSGPISLDQVTGQHLIGMVLQPEEVQAGLPGLTLISAGALTAQDVARHSFDPTDTGDNLIKEGFQVAYEHSFGTPQIPLSVTVPARAYLWDEVQAAEKFLHRSVTEGQRLVGEGLQGGMVVSSYDSFQPPTLGDASVAATVSGSTVMFPGVSFETTVVSWRRGPIVATVGVLAVDGEDRRTLLSSLATTMDRRIDGVLEGRIIAEAQTVAIPREETPLDPQQVDLEAMMIAPPDLLADVVVESDGPLVTSSAIKAYGRSFRPDGETIRLGSSELTQLDIKLELYSSSQLAAFPVAFLKSLSAEKLAEAARQQTLPPGSGFSAPTIEHPNLPEFGDLSAAVLSKFQTASGGVEAVVVHFARGQLAAQLTFVGPLGRISLEDIVDLSQAFDQRILQHLP